MHITYCLTRTNLPSNYYICICIYMYLYMYIYIYTYFIIDYYYYYYSGNFRTLQSMANTTYQSPLQLFYRNHHPTPPHYITLFLHAIITIIVSVMLRLNRIQYHAQCVLPSAFPTPHLPNTLS